MYLDKCAKHIPIVHKIKRLGITWNIASKRTIKQPQQFPLLPDAPQHIHADSVNPDTLKIRNTSTTKSIIGLTKKQSAVAQSAHNYPYAFSTKYIYFLNIILTESEIKSFSVASMIPYSFHVGVLTIFKIIFRN